jgi:hypothetical protein
MSTLIPGGLPTSEVAKEAATDLTRLIGLIPGAVKATRSGIARWKEARRVENQITLQPVYARIDIPAADQATIEFMLWVSNFSKRVIEPDRLELSSIAVGGRSLQRSSDMRKVQGEVSRRTASNLWFTIDLRGSDVRELVLGINKANNSWSSPQTTVRIYAEIVFLSGSRRFRKPVNFQWDWATSNVVISAVEKLP